VSQSRPKDHAVKLITSIAGAAAIAVGIACAPAVHAVIT
jgi:hypothetical protein